MSANLILAFMGVYFAVLLGIAWITSRKSGTNTFFNADHSAPWYIVAYGLIGTSLSAVSLISVTGKVRDDGFHYMHTVLGYVVGYLIISFVLLPMYYRLKLVSIYNYLEIRFGPKARKMGAIFFLVSRALGAAARLYLMVIVLQTLVFSHYNIPFEGAVAVVLLLIFLYTFQSGIKTIIWTDTLQTTLLIAAIIMSIVSLKDGLHLGWGDIITLANNNHYTDWYNGLGPFLKSFISGAMICATMTGLDQGMMQRSLSCHNLWDAQKNILSFTGVIVVINALFMLLGAMLAVFVLQQGITGLTSDKLYPFVASNYFSAIAGGLFVMGLIAATFSSADDALAALTTSFCLDILGLDPEKPGAKRTRIMVHSGFAFLMFLIIVIFFKDSQKAVIDLVLLLASYTYGPLLGMFAFGLFTKARVADKQMPWITLVCPLLMVALAAYSGYIQIPQNTLSTGTLDYWFTLISRGFGNEVIIYNGALCFAFMWLFADKNGMEKTEFAA